MMSDIDGFYNLKIKTEKVEMEMAIVVKTYVSPLGEKSLKDQITKEALEFI